MVCKGSVCPEKLPPTERAAFFHGLRVYYQIRQWLIVQEDINMFEWGWVKDENKAVPIQTDRDVAPPEIKKRSSMRLQSRQCKHV